MTMRKRMMVFTVVVVTSVAMVGCEGFEDRKVLGPLLGAGAGAGIVALFGGSTEAIIAGAVIGGVATAVVQNQWRKAEAREARRYQRESQEEVNSAWRSAGNPMPRTPEVAIHHDQSTIAPQRQAYREYDKVQFDLAYATLGDGMSDVSVCRSDELALYDRTSGKFDLVNNDSVLLERCDLEKGSGGNVSELDIPGEVQHGVYMYRSKVELKRNGVTIDEADHPYIFAVGQDAVEDLPAARNAVAAAQRDMRFAMAQ